MDLDRIRACIEINELPSFALVQSICPGELISSVAPALSCLSLGCVLVGANISHLNSAVVTPAAKPAPTAAPPTPKPRQSLLTVLTSGVKMKATATARKKPAAKAAVSDLPASQALKSASLPVKSKNASTGTQSRKLAAATTQLTSTPRCSQRTSASVLVGFYDTSGARVLSAQARGTE